MPTSHIEKKQQTEGILCSCLKCGKKVLAASPQEEKEFDRNHRSCKQKNASSAEFYGAGDLVAGLTKAIGVDPCSGCERRRAAMNRMFPKVWKRRKNKKKQYARNYGD